MSDLRNGAESISTTADEISAEIPKYRDMAETITEIVIMTAALVALTCLVIIAKQMSK